MKKHLIRKRKEKGVVLVITFMIFMLLAIAGSEYIDHSTQSLRVARRRENEIQTVNLCEAGAQEVFLNLWLPLQTNQTFAAFDASTAGASVSSPHSSIQDTIPGVGAFAAGVISVTSPDTYTRIVTVRTTGWIDLNNNGLLDGNEPFKVVDITATYSLDRSKVFDYTYFVNNYGWMDGFSQTQLIVNGDMRANGNFNFTNGSPTVNGSVYAAFNQNLAPLDQGLSDTPPVKMSDSQYQSLETQQGSGAVNNQNRMRQDYQSSIFGAPGTSEYETYIGLTFGSTGSIDSTTESPVGSFLADATGVKSWQLTNSGANATETILDSTPTQQLIMPDLSNLATYQAASTTYVDTSATYANGQTNPYYNKGAFIESWNTLTNSYQTVTVAGNVSGSAILVGTPAHPIIVHGPSTVSQDVLIEGTVSGQGTIYAGRNVHIIGSIIYNDPPNFTGSNPTAIDNQNSSADLLALCARGSVIMGNPTQFTAQYPLQYMTPPFTIGRYDQNGNWIPPFNAYNVDSTGRMLYQSVVPDATMNSLAQNVNQIDAVLYTNFCGGGNLGQGGTGLQFNGSIISKNEAMVVDSLPMIENYDNRIHERSLTAQPLINVNLPRSPALLISAWQDRGFTWVGM
jgi:hypothetical protein